MSELVRLGLALVGFAGAAASSGAGGRTTPWAHRCR